MECKTDAFGSRARTGPETSTCGVASRLRSNRGSTVSVPEPAGDAAAGDGALVCDLEVPLRLQPIGPDGADVVDFALRASNRIRQVSDGMSHLVAFRLRRFGYFQD